jgi:signal transduction histidine kinase
MSLKNRTLLWFSAVIGIILIAFSFTFYYLLRKNINLDIKSYLYRHATQLQNELGSGKPINPPKDKTLSFVVTKRSTVIFKSASIEKKLLRLPKNFYIFDNGGETIQALYILRFEHPFSGAIYVYKKGIDDKSDDIAQTLLILNPTLLLVLIIAGNFLIDRLLRPVKNMTAAIEKVSVENFTTTIPNPKPHNELGRLIGAYNEMILRLKEGVSTLERFNSDVSHELKTPLTVVRGEIELALKKERSALSYQNSLRRVAYEIEQIEAIVTNLLLLTRYTKENIAEQFETCDLEAILQQVLQSLTPQLRQKKLSLHLQTVEPVSIQANPTLIRLIFYNLIDNAIKYSYSNGKITLLLFQEDALYFIVKDEGIGIPQEEIAKITRRFYRVDTSRTRQIQGFGLGLALVQKSVTLHGGTLHIDSDHGRGTTVRVKL